LTQKKLINFTIIADKAQIRTGTGQVQLAAKKHGKRKGKGFYSLRVMHLLRFYSTKALSGQVLKA